MNQTKFIYNQISDFNPDLLKRTEKVQKKYDLLLAKLEKSKILPSELVLDSFFVHDKQRISVVKNEYPYDLKSLEVYKIRPSPDLSFEYRTGERGEKLDLEHWIMWSKEPLQHQDIIAFLSLWCGQINIYAIWENSENRKSVKDLYHYHFILKN